MRFEDLFDFDNDGKLDGFETATFASFVSGLSQEEEEELEMDGLDVDELELMDEDERREALEEAGLDPDDYDF